MNTKKTTIPVKKTAGNILNSMTKMNLESPTTTSKANSLPKQSVIPVSPQNATPIKSNASAFNPQGNFLTKLNAPNPQPTISTKLNIPNSQPNISTKTNILNSQPNISNNLTKTNTSTSQPNIPTKANIPISQPNISNTSTKTNISNSQPNISNTSTKSNIPISQANISNFSTKSNTFNSQPTLLNTSTKSNALNSQPNVPTKANIPISQPTKVTSSPNNNNSFINSNSTNLVQAENLFNEGVSFGYLSNVRQAKKKFLESGNQGYVLGYLRLYLALLNESNPEAFKYKENAEKAFFWLSQEIEKKDSKLSFYEYHLGLCYEYGVGVKQSLETAINYFKNLSVKAYVDSIIKMGLLLEQGLISSKEGTALEFYKKASSQGSCLGTTLYAFCLSKNSSQSLQQEAKEKFKIAAKEGNLLALHFVALYEGFKEGMNIPESIKTAAQAGFSPSIVCLVKAKIPVEFESYDFPLNLEKGEKLFQEGLELLSLDLSKKSLLKFIESAYYGYPPAYLQVYFSLLSTQNPEAIKYKNSAEKAVSWVQNQIGKKDSKLGLYQFLLGNSYEIGFGVEQNGPQSVNFLQNSANNGFVFALIKLGKNFIHTRATVSFEYFQTAAKKENLSALTLVGECYEKGIGIGLNVPKAKEIYEKAADKGNTKAMVAVGNIFFHSNLMEKALFYFKKAAESEELEAIKNLIKFNEISNSIKSQNLSSNNNVVPTKQNKEKKEKEKEIETGLSLFIRAEDCLALTGITFAIQYFKKSVDLNFLPSNLMLFVLLSDKKDPEANKYKENAEKVFFFAQEEEKKKENAKMYHYLMAICYEKGIGVSVDLKKALELYTLSAEGGYHSAYRNLAFLYEKGIGVSQNWGKVVEFAEKSEASDSFWGNGMLGICYENGFGVKKDFEVAFDYYREAYFQGCVIGIYGLACFYEKGIGRNQALIKAQNYFQEAADAGYLPAIEALKRFKGKNFESTAEDEIEEYLWKGAEEESEDSLFEIAKIYKNWCEKETAIEYFEKVTEVGFHYVGEAWYELGDIHDIINCDKAQKCFRNAVDEGYSFAEGRLDGSDNDHEDD